MRRIDHTRFRQTFAERQAGRASHHTAASRTRPSVFQYDYLTLSRLSADIDDLLDTAGRVTTGTALDIGSAASPYRSRLETLGYSLETLDIDADSGADHVAAADETRLDADRYDLIVCTQVLEHVPYPRRVLAEIRRILRPGGYLVASVPHVWFYHPHPSDYWRFTGEGIVQLCEDAGMQLVELRAQGGSALTLFQCVNFLIYGLVGRLGGPIFAAFNALGAAADAIVHDDLFAHNFAFLASKPGASEPGT